MFRLSTSGPLLLAAVLLCGLVFTTSGIRRSAYVDDGAALNQAVARSIAATGIFGIEGEPRPAVHDAWWRWLGGHVAAVTGADPAAVFGAGAMVLGVFLIVLLVTITGLQYPEHPVAGWAAGLLLALSPPLAVWCVNGSSGPLAALLVLLAVVVHMSSCGDGRPLPLSSAVAIGFAACLRLEFIAVWLALMVHGIVSAWMRRGVSSAAVVIRGFNGVVVCLILLAPLVMWNLRVIAVPWPRGYDAAMALDTLAGGVGAVIPGSIGSALSAAVHGAYRLALHTGFTGSGFILPLAVVGLLYWMIRSRGGSRDNYLCLAMVLGLTPLFHALLVPFIGWKGAAPMYEALAPLWVLAVVAALAALQHGLDPLLVRLVPAFSNRARHTAVFAAFAVTPLLAGYLQTRGELHADAAGAERASQATESLIASLAEAGVDVVLTDQPGRLFGRMDVPVIDLTAELNPELLAFMAGVPSSDLVAIAGYYREIGHQRIGLVVWNRGYWIDETNPPCGDIGSAGAGPFVCVW